MTISNILGDSGFEVESWQDLEQVHWPDAVVAYFQTLNAKTFDRASALFAAEGILVPPFEEPIVGRMAIADYLDREASQLTVVPQTAKAQPGEEDCLQVQVRGRATLPWFSVTVTWLFILNAAGRIALVRIDLVASAKELLSLSAFAPKPGKR